jgi:DtxR family Mn-dependent transcriptional regulator
MGNGKHREHALEAILMAEEAGDTTLEGLRREHDEEVSAEEVEAAVAEGLAERDGEGVRLTAEGRRLAEDVIRRHRLVEVMLATMLGLDRERASQIGCLVEHDLRPEMVDSVCTLLGHPATCPHGRPIPAGPCCRDGRTTVETQVVPLTALAPGERGRVIYITPRSHHRMHRLSSLGLTPGTVVEVHQRRPVYCIRFEETELAVERDVAEDVHVCRIPASRDEPC